MKIAICDNDIYSLRLLLHYLKKYKMDEDVKFIVVSFVSGTDLINYIKVNADVDIIFLAINMPQLNGLKIANEIRKMDKYINIFLLSSILNYVLEGYKLKAINYLLKPLKYEKFHTELRELLNSTTIESKNFFIEKNDNGIFKIYFTEILFIETYNRNTLIHTLNNTILSYKTMKTHSITLNNSFFRCHTAFIVNLNYVKEVNKNNKIILKNGYEIPVSKNKKKDFMDSFFTYYRKQTV